MLDALVNGFVYWILPGSVILYIVIATIAVTSKPRSK